MGPTELLPGSQYYTGGDGCRFDPQQDEWCGSPVPLACEKGAFVLMHYDLWHRALQNRSDSVRFMVKVCHSPLR
jgi:ectoine hydroxylase-related dioxygenase (phytanoyl-CoA dioxygenase family)